MKIFFILLFVMFSATLSLEAYGQSVKNEGSYTLEEVQCFEGHSPKTD